MEQLKSIHLPIELVLHIITCSLPKPNVLIAPSHPITQLLLSFTFVCKETRRLSHRYLLEYCMYFSHPSRLESYFREAKTRPELRNISALLLAPFRGQTDGFSIVISIQGLLTYTSTTLKRLIIDIPLRLFALDEDDGVILAIFREGLARLANLEEFVSVRDDLTLNSIEDEPAFWAQWKRLKRLAIYNVHIDARFWNDVTTMPQIKTIVLTRADGLEQSNFKREYFKHGHGPLKVLLCNVDESQIRFTQMLRAGWDTVDPEKKMTIMTYTIPLPFQDDNVVETCQEYVRIGAENGTLWDWEGEIIQHRPKPYP
jgi:hypothetical protein